jgi:hypothetical protein
VRSCGGPVILISGTNPSCNQLNALSNYLGDTAPSLLVDAAAEHLGSPNYIQHSAHSEPGREGLINLIMIFFVVRDQQVK